MCKHNKRNIKIITLQSDFFHLFDDGSDKELLLIKEDMKRRPCLILMKIKYNSRNYTFAVPFRSNISNSTPSNTYFSLPPRKATKCFHSHGLHYTKAFPVNSKYFSPYFMGGDVQEELTLAIIEKNLKSIINDLQKYVTNYENGIREKYCIDIDNAIKKQGL